MKKCLSASGIFIAIASTYIALTPGAVAQGSCVSLKFPADGDSVIIEGLAPANDIVCYRLDTRPGQKITLKVVRGANTIFSVPGVQDAEDHLTFTAQNPNYDINVGQLMRAASPEKFRISIERSRGNKKSSIDGNSILHAAHVRSEEARTSAEIATVGLKDVSTATRPDEPTARDILVLVLRRLDQINADTRDRERRCKARDFRPEDVILVHRCSQVMALRQGRGGFRLVLQHLSKLGCVPLGHKHQFECRFEISLATNSNLFRDEAGRRFSEPVVQKARLVRNADGEWSMVKGTMQPSESPI